MKNKTTVLYKGRFYLVDDVASFDPKKAGSGVGATEIDRLTEEDSDQPARNAAATSANQGLSLEEQVQQIIGDGYEAEDDNTSTPGTVAWLKAELEAMGVKYDPNSKAEDLRRLFVEEVTSSDQG